MGGSLSARPRPAKNIVLAPPALNDQGKLPIPKDLGETVGLAPDAEVVLARRGEPFEIWNKAKFDTVLEIEVGNQDRDELGTFW
jgi:DNA-binding transcriptional regulator/RsmH inhibitor MraZ